MRAIKENQGISVSLCTHKKLPFPPGVGVLEMEWRAEAREPGGELRVEEASSKPAIRFPGAVSWAMGLGLGMVREEVGESEPKNAGEKEMEKNI